MIVEVENTAARTPEEPGFVDCVPIPNNPYSPYHMFMHLVADRYGVEIEQNTMHEDGRHKDYLAAQAPDVQTRVKLTSLYVSTFGSPIMQLLQAVDGGRYNQIATMKGVSSPTRQACFVTAYERASRDAIATKIAMRDRDAYVSRVIDGSVLFGMLALLWSPEKRAHAHHGSVSKQYARLRTRGVEAISPTQLQALYYPTIAEALTRHPTLHPESVWMRT